MSNVYKARVAQAIESHERRKAGLPPVADAAAGYERLARACMGLLGWYERNYKRLRMNEDDKRAWFIFTRAVEQARKETGQ